MAVRILFVAAALGLAASIVWASGQAPLWDSVVKVAADPWGLVMLVDLYAGFLAAAALFLASEGAGHLTGIELDLSGGALLPLASR